MSNWQSQNDEQWPKLHYILDDRSRPALLWITCDSYRHRRQTYSRFQQEFPKGLHIEVGLQEFDGPSLAAYLAGYIPPSSETPVFLHLWGLESLLGIGLDPTRSRLLESLNFEREKLFHYTPATLVFWSETYSQIKTQQLAPDFWDWLTYKIHFEAPPELPPKDTAGFIQAEDLPVPGENREEIYNQTARLLHSLENTTNSERDNLSLLEAIANNYYQLQDFPKAIYYTKKILERTDLLSEEHQAMLFNRMGKLLYHTGDYTHALIFWEKSLPYFQKLGHKVAEGRLLNNISQIYYEHSDYSKALSYLEQSLKISFETGDKLNEGMTLGNISQVYDAQGDYKKALQYLEQSLAISREVGDKSDEAKTLGNIGNSYFEQGDYKTSLSFLEQSLKISQEIGDKLVEGRSAGNIGKIYDALGDYKKALEYLQQSLYILDRIGDKSGRGKVLGIIGTIYFAQNDYKAALDYLEKSLDIMKEIGDRLNEGNGLNNIGEIYKAQGNSEMAIKYLEQGLSLSREIGDKPGEIKSLNNLAFIEYKKKNYDLSLQYSEQSLNVSREIKDKYNEGLTLHNIAQIYASWSDYEMALKYLKESFYIRRETGDKLGQANVLNNIAIIILEYERKPVEAVPLFVQAHALFQAIGSPDVKVPQTYLSQIRTQLGEARFQEIVGKMEG